jgi:2'-5' RNA ligase
VGRFFVEYRLHGYAKEYARDLVDEVARKFMVRRTTGTRAVPHVTLYGPSETNGTVSVRRIVSEVERVGRRYTLVACRIKGFGCFAEENKRKVIYLGIEPSLSLQNMRRDLAQALRGISVPTEYDREQDYEFHSTILIVDDEARFRRIWEFIKSKEPPDMAQYVPRVTILGGNRRIICEYDLVLRRVLDRRQALSRRWWRKTTTRMRELQGLPRLKTDRKSVV